MQSAESDLGAHEERPTCARTRREQHGNQAGYCGHAQRCQDRSRRNQTRSTGGIFALTGAESHRRFGQGTSASDPGQGFLRPRLGPPTCGRPEPRTPRSRHGG